MQGGSGTPVPQSSGAGLRPAPVLVGSHSCLHSVSGTHWHCGQLLACAAPAVPLAARGLRCVWAGGRRRVCVLSCLFAGFGYGPPPPPPDQFAPPGVPPPPATPGAAPLAFPPPPSQAAPDMSKAPTAQPDFPYSQYGGCPLPCPALPSGVCLPRGWIPGWAVRGGHMTWGLTAWSGILVFC